MPVLRTPNAGPQAILALCAGFFGLFFMAKHFFSTSNSSYQIVMSQFIKDYNITKREAEIIEMIMRGYRNAKIADELFISVKTVKNHLYHIFQKAGVDNRTGLIAEVNKTNGVGVRNIDIY
jgi:DNA-binding CsgD family transcriptional regulator